MKKHILFSLIATFLWVGGSCACTRELAQIIKNDIVIRDENGPCRSFSFSPPLSIQLGSKEILLSFVKVFPCRTPDFIYMIGNIRDDTRNPYRHEAEDISSAQFILNNPGILREVFVNFGQNGKGFRTNEILVYWGKWETFFESDPFPEERWTSMFNVGGGLPLEDQRRLLLERLLQMGQATRVPGS
jgi:hypothetical protein